MNWNFKMTKSSFLTSCLASLIVLFGHAIPSNAQLKLSEKAPDFTAPAIMNGKQVNLNLKNELKKGPVIVYFYPKAFTGGCSLQTKEFTNNISALNKKKVTIIGVSVDELSVLKDFSKSHCNGKFPLVSDKDKKISKAYNTLSALSGLSSRTTYLIDKNGKIIFVTNSNQAIDHVTLAVDAVNKMK